MSPVNLDLLYNMVFLPTDALIYTSMGHQTKVNHAEYKDG